MNDGFIVLHRKIIKTAFFNDHYACRIAIFLLLEASFADHQIIWNGKPYILKRGQCVIGGHKLSSDLGIPQPTIWRKLVLLENLGFLNREVTRQNTLVTIRKYRDYQDKSFVGESHDESRMNHGRITDEYNTTKVTKVTKNIFIIPTISEVTEYIKEIGGSIDDSLAFFDHHQTFGWKVGVKAMKDWKAACRTWMRNKKKWAGNNPTVKKESVPFKAGT